MGQNFIIKKNSIKLLLKNNSFIIFMFGVVCFSLIWQKPGLYIKEIGLLQVFTFVGMFVSGLSLSLKNVKESVLHYRHILFAFCMSYLILPVLAFALGKVFFSDQTDLFIGAMIISTQATTVASAVVITMTAGGNVPLAIIITIINNLCSAFISPFLLNSATSVDGRISFDVLSMTLNLATVMIVPAIIAQIFRHLFSKYMQFINPWRKVISNGVILSFVLIGMSSAALQIMENAKLIPMVLAFAILLHGGGLLIVLLYHRFARLDSKDLPAILFCSTQKTLTTSTMVWGSYFFQFSMAPIVLVCYHITQICMDSFIGGIMQKRLKGTNL